MLVVITACLNYLGDGSVFIPCSFISVARVAADLHILCGCWCSFRLAWCRFSLSPTFYTSHFTNSLPPPHCTERGLFSDWCAVNNKALSRDGRHRMALVTRVNWW